MSKISNLVGRWPLLRSVVVAGVVLAFGAWFLWGGRPRAGITPGPAPLRATPAFAEDPRRSGDLDSLGSLGHARAIAAPSTDAAIYRVHARLHASDGSLADASRARWRIRCADGAGGGHTVEKAFEGDEFSVEARPWSELVVVEGCLGERLISPRTPTLLLGEERDITLLGDLPRDGYVRVVDARNSVDLANVRVVPWTCGGEDTRLPPLAALRSRCYREVASPFVLPANPVNLGYWIGAEGFAWRRIEFGQASNDPVYALDRGGALRVDARPPTDLSMQFTLILERVIETSGRVELLAEEPLDSRAPLEFSGLSPGKTAVRVVASKDGARGLPLVERWIEVVAGATEQLALDLDALWHADDLGDISVTLLPEEPSDASTLEVRCHALDASLPDPPAAPVRWLKRGKDGDLRWNSGHRPAGRYLVSLSPSSAEVEVQVRPGSIARATLAIPALPRLRLWVLDDANHSIPADQIVWRMQQSPETDWNIADWHARDGAAEFAVAPGHVEFGVQATGYISARFVLDVSPGWNEQMVELQPFDSREILVHLFTADNSVPAPEETWTETTVTDAQGRSAVLGMKIRSGTPHDDSPSDGASSILVVKGPGTYQLALGRVPGFKLPEPQTVTVDEARATVEIELVPGP